MVEKTFDSLNACFENANIYDEIKPMAVSTPASMFQDIFSKSTFSNNSFRNTIRVSNSLDPDQARCSVVLLGLIWVQIVCIGY